ncbi:MAG: hypothetical protein KDJ41_18595 [Hyphomicrobiaceae bacterium]|nr:hypothetical protein [Hyphomicrobiaceae bacterium]
MTIRFLDPTHEADSRAFVAAPRLAALDGATVAIISNGKKSTKPFFDAIEAELKGRYRVASVVRLTKYNYSAPVEPELLKEAAKWHAIITGVGD